MHASFPDPENTGGRKEIVVKLRESPLLHTSKRGMSFTAVRISFARPREL